MRRQVTICSPRRATGMIVFVIASLSFWMSSQPVDAADDEPVRILLLYPSDLTLPAAVVQDQITRNAVTAALGRPIEFYSEGYDELRLGDANQEQFTRFLKDKYASRPPQLIIAHGPMHRILRRYSDMLWPGTPRMFVDVGIDRLREKAMPAGMPGTAVQMDIAGTVELALRLQPQTRHLVVIGGDALHDREGLARAMHDLQPLQGRVRIETLTGRRVEEIVARLSALEPESIALYLTVLRDSAGNVYVPREVLSVLARASAAPIYSYYDTYIGHGIVGGKLMNREGQGPAIGEIARRLLRGEAPQSVPIAAAAPATCVLDWRQIERWNIEERRIPQECRVMFREASFWQRHRTWLIIGALAVVLQIAWLLAWRVQRQRRRKAEGAARLRTSELTHAARLGTVGGLMASITHEISQPLMSILANAAAGERMIAAGQPDMEEIRSILSDIRSDDTRAGAVISHLREFLKKREVSMEPVHITELVAKVLKIIESVARKHQVEVIATFDEEVPLVAGDPVHLQQVMLNLALNGIEAMSAQTGRHRKLTFRTARTQQRGVEIAVSDTGRGIAPEQLARLFEPFYSTKPDGMGIGLSIAQTIVDAHGGRIWAESNDGGATVRFSLPPLRERASGAHETARCESEPH